MTILDQVKSLLGIEDHLQDELLGTIKKLTEAHFKALTGQETVPDTLSFVIVEVMVKRFNRIGSEGLTSHSVEGLSMSFDVSDFSAYEGLLANLFPKKLGAGVKFL